MRRTAIHSARLHGFAHSTPCSLQRSPFASPQLKLKPMRDATEADVHVVEGPCLAANQSFERRWTLGKTPNAIERIEIAVPGLVYVSHDASKPSSVRFSGDSREILERVEVAAAAPDTVHVRAKGLMDGHLLTEISLQRASAVRAFSSAGSVTTVVEDGVLVSCDSQHSLTLDAAGSGDVFIGSSAPMRLHSLSICGAGGGDVQVVAPAILCEGETRVRTRGSGDVNVFTNALTTQSAHLQVAGSGDVNVDVADVLQVRGALETRIAGAGNATALCRVLDATAVSLAVAGSGNSTVATWEKLAAATISADVVGSGDVVVASAGAGAASLVNVRVAGSGSVDVADVFADTAKIHVAGSGDVAVRVGAEAHEALFGSGSVAFVGGRPREIHTTGSRAPFGGARAEPDAARPLAAVLDYQRRRFPSPAPAREAAFAQIRARHVSLDMKSALGSIWSAFRA